MFMLLIVFNLLLLLLCTHCYVFKDNNPRINYSCVTDTDCLKFNLENNFCKNNLCACKNQNDCRESTLMIPIRSVRNVGLICNQQIECVINNSNCVNSTCQCNDDFTSSSTKKECLPLASSLFSYCVEDVQCKKFNGICSNSKCICQDNSIEYNGFCLRSIGIGEACKMNNECTHIKNSHCTGGKCTCNIGHVPSGKFTCLLQAEFIESICTDNIQCTATLGTGSECVRNKCQCKDLYHYKGSANQCVHDLLLGETCYQHEDCHQPGNSPSRLECLVGECHCKYPYYQHEDYCISESQTVYYSFLLYLVTLSLIIFATF